MTQVCQVKQERQEELAVLNLLSTLIVDAPGKKKLEYHEFFIAVKSWNSSRKTGELGRGNDQKGIISFG